MEDFCNFLYKAFAVELNAGDIHGHLNRIIHQGLPLGRFLAGTLQDEGAQGNDQTTFLRYGNELQRRY